MEKLSTKNNILTSDLENTQRELEIVKVLFQNKKKEYEELTEENNQLNNESEEIQ